MANSGMDSGMGGMGGIDVSAVVTKMMEYQLLKSYRLQSTKQVQQIQISAYGQLQGLFSTFQNQLKAVGDAFATVSYQAIAANPSIAAVTVLNNNVAVGTHNLDNVVLATATKYTSAMSFTQNNQALNLTETLTLTNSAQPPASFNLQINPTDSLQTIRDHINTSMSNIGISASIIGSQGPNGTQYNLILTSATGAANAFTIAGDTNNIFGPTADTVGTDATFTFDGYTEVSASNTNIQNVLDGLSINLLSSGSTTITVGQNDTDVTGTVTKSINNMLASYNQIITFLDGEQYVSVYDEKNNKYSSAINTNFQYIKMQLQSAMNTVYSGQGDILNLTEAGIIPSHSTEVTDQLDAHNPKRVYVSSGSLEVNPYLNTASDNQTTLAYNLSEDFNSLNDFFTNPTSGLIANVNQSINNAILAPNNIGMIATSISSIKQLQSFNDQAIDTENVRLQNVQNDLIMTYSKLNATLVQYQNLSKYLDKQYAALENLYKGK